MKTKHLFLSASKSKFIFFWLCIFLLFVSGIGYAQKVQTVPVTTADAMKKDLPIQIRTFGNIEAYSSVSVKTKVGGELTKIFFQEGQDVREGEPLFTIDPAPYEAALNEAKAKLARDQALADNAKSDLKRYESLYQEGIVSKEQYDQARSNSDSLEATVEADKASLESSQLDLSYCFIHSPISGRTGSLLVNRGNIIKENDAVLVVINQIQPIYVNFVIPEQYLPEVMRRMAQEKLAVQAIVPNQNEHRAEGTLTFLDNEVDQKTGTVKLKAVFANKEKFLWPGQFVDVVLIYGLRSNVVVIPSRALQTGQQGSFVFVVKGDNTVELKPVVPGLTINDETIIEKGIEAGEKVVTDGQLRLVSGSHVEIKNSAFRE